MRPAGLEEAPQIEELGGRPGLEPVVEFQVAQLDVQLHRLPARFAEAHLALGAQGGHAVLALGMVEREDAVLDVAGRGELVHGVGELGAVPDAVAEPGLHGVMQPGAGRGLGVVAGPHLVQVDHAAVECQLAIRRPGLGRDPLPDRLRERQPAQLAVEHHLAGVEVDRPAQLHAAQDIAPGRAVEPVHEAPGLFLLDPDAHVVEDRRAVVGRTVLATDQLDGPFLDQDGRGLVQPGTRPRGREQALEVPGAVPALAEPQRRLDHCDLAHVQLAAQQFAGIHQDLQPGDAQRLEHPAVDLLIDPGIVQGQLAEPARHADTPRVELRARQVAHGVPPDPPRRIGAVGHVGIREPEPAAEDRQAEHQAPDQHLGHAFTDPHRVKPLPWGRGDGSGAVRIASYLARTEPRPTERHPNAARPSAGISPGMR